MRGIELLIGTGESYGELISQLLYVLYRNLKIAFFSQHHVDQLVMEVSALEFIQSKFPGNEAV